MRWGFAEPLCMLSWYYWGSTCCFDAATAAASAASVVVYIVDGGALSLGLSRVPVLDIGWHFR